MEIKDYRFMSEEEIKKDIKKYIDSHKGTYKNWYVGIAENFDEKKEKHKLRDIKGTPWICIAIESSAMAGRVKEYIVGLGVSAGLDSDKEIENTVVVYAYKKAPYTKP